MGRGQALTDYWRWQNDGRQVVLDECIAESYPLREHKGYTRHLLGGLSCRIVNKHLRFW
jgi:hypothetical protein